LWLLFGGGQKGADAPHRPNPKRDRLARGQLQKSLQASNDQAHVGLVTAELLGQLLLGELAGGVEGAHLLLPVIAHPCVQVARAFWAAWALHAVNTGSVYRFADDVPICLKVDGNLSLGGACRPHAHKSANLFWRKLTTAQLVPPPVHHVLGVVLVVPYHQVPRVAAPRVVALVSNNLAARD
jgi:hypothetical protein